MDSAVKMISKLLLFCFYCLLAGNAFSAQPSFNCKDTAEGSIERLICNDDTLSALDRKLASVYAMAQQKAINEHPPVLKAEQRGWIKGRDECWKSDDKRTCVEQSYLRRIAELQALYRLVPIQATIRYQCEGSQVNEVIATYFETDPATLIAERGDSVSLMYHQRTASGAKYQGRNEMLWEHHGEALIVWGHNAPEMRCQGVPMVQAQSLPGSPDWLEEVEKLVMTGDGAGHGPDLGSQEWMYTVGRKLGIYDSQDHGPDPGSEEWYQAVQDKVKIIRDDAAKKSCVNISGGACSLHATEILQQAEQDCNSFENGVFNATENAITRHDITGDGHPEEFIDTAGFSCSTALSLWGGTGGTYLWVIVDGKAHDFLAHKWRLVDFDGQKVLLLAVHSSECSDDVGPCYRALVWQDGFRTVR